MPSKILTSEGNYLSFSQVLSRNMSLPGNPNIVNLLYVLDRPPVPNLNELNQPNRLESMQNILEQNDSNSDSQQQQQQQNQQNDNKQLINRSYDNFINLPKIQTTSTNFNQNNLFNKIEDDLINLNDDDIDNEKSKPIFSVPFINSKNYKPNYGLHKTGLLYNGSRFIGHQKSKGNFNLKIIIDIN